MEHRSVRLNECAKQLWKKKRQETSRENSENEIAFKLGQGVAAPASELSKSELKIVQENIMVQNLLRLGAGLPQNKKSFVLRAFFKHKRNQLVEVLSRNGEKVVRTLGKVNVIGRDFVVLTTLKDRIWLPYVMIESAGVPDGLPFASNAHQHLVFDQELRRKLIIQCGETAVKRDELISRCCYEETLQSNLQKWSKTRAEITTATGRRSGRITEVANGALVIRNLQGSSVIPLADITFIRTWRWMQWIPSL